MWILRSFVRRLKSARPLIWSRLVIKVRYASIEGKLCAFILPAWEDELGIPWLWWMWRHWWWYWSCCGVRLYSTLLMGMVNVGRQSLKRRRSVRLCASAQPVMATQASPLSAASRWRNSFLPCLCTVYKYSPLGHQQDEVVQCLRLNISLAITIPICCNLTNILAQQKCGSKFPSSIFISSPAISLCSLGNSTLNYLIYLYVCFCLVCR